jgi:hypothetical protein
VDELTPRDPGHPPEDLAVALGNFDAGYPSDHAAAMRETVLGRMITTLRDGVIKGHVFFPVDAALQIARPNAPHHAMCTYMFVHECAHVQDLSTRGQCMHEGILNPPLAQPLAISLQITWNEYAACRLAAFSCPEQVGDFKELLRQNVATLIDSRDEVRSAFEPTIEGRQLALTMALNLVLPVLQSFCYLLGHCRGTGVSLAGNVPESFASLMKHQPTNEAFDGLEHQLDLLWDSRDAWRSFSVFDDLITTICGLIRVLTGLVIARRDGRSMAVALAF